MKTPSEIIHLLSPVCHRVGVEKILISINQWSDSLIGKVDVTLYSADLTSDGQNVFTITVSTSYEDFDFRALELKIAASYLEITGKYIL